jgi:cytoskeleton protein RodZ
MSEIETDANEARPATAGAQLKAGREAAGFDLADVASRTRIPLRHLQALEEDDFHALPSPTYSVGFAKAHARAVGLDEVAIGAQVRTQLDRDGRERAEYIAFEPADPARVPSRVLAWTAAIIAVVLLAGYGLWRSQWLSGPGTNVSSEIAATPPVGTAPPPPMAAVAPAPTTGPVVLTAIDTVWLRVYDDAGTRLFEKEMAAGERYEVPADANNPQLLTGRPQALRVTVGSREIPPLGPADRTVADVPISAAALSARAAAPPAPAPVP